MPISRKEYNLKEKRIKEKAKKNIEIFLRELEKRSKDPNFSEDEFIDELRCEMNIYGKYHSEEEILEYIREIHHLGRDNIRRDLVNRAYDSCKEKQIRNELAGILKEVRISSNNGFKNLKRSKQYNKLCNWISYVSDVLGNDNLYFSNRYDKIGKLIPLRKDVTRYVFSKALDIFKENSTNRLD